MRRGPDDDDEIHAVDARGNDALPVRQVHRRRRRTIQTDAVDITDDADNQDGWPRWSADVKLLADRILAGPQMLGRNGGHHGDASVAVRLGKVPPLPPRHAHRTEVVGTDGPNITSDALVSDRSALRP